VLNIKITGWWTPTDLGTWDETSSGTPKLVKAHRLVAEKLKNSSKFSNNILKRKHNNKKNKKGKTRKSKERGIIIWKRQLGRYV
jgi:hypothetical protein